MKKTEIILKEGYPFIFVSGAIALLSLLTDASLFWQLVFIGFTLFFTYFFRNPERIPDDESRGVIISPSDGEVIEICETEEKFFTNEKMLKISIRLSIFDCHIQRTPIESKIEEQNYIHGEFLSLNNEKASELNEQNRTLFVDDETKIVTNQIAGFITRRIVDFVDKGTDLKLAQRYGMIMFGSQVDLYIPKNSVIKISVGDLLLACESVIGFLSEEN